MSETERAYLVEAALAPDASVRREPVRPAHLTRLRDLMADGRVLAAGALEDMSASIILVRADDEGSARELVACDPYVATGVWTAIRVREIQLVKP